jgi:hypothetical protein
MKKVIFALFTLFVGCGESDIALLPRNLSWANIDLNGDGVKENYITPIKNQPCSDCYIYAALALVEARYQIDHRTAVGLDLSEQNLHNCLRISCDASGGEDGILDYVRDFGVMLEEDSPTGKWRADCDNCAGTVKTGIGDLDVKSVPFFRIKGHKYVELPKNYSERKNFLVRALQKGPFDIDINSWLGYRKRSDFFFCEKKDPSGHEVLLVGYENYGEIFIVKNSWGEDELLRIVFDGGELCGFAPNANMLEPESVYMAWGGGEKFCYASDDFDHDGVPNARDNCLYAPNPNQENTDNDLLGDACDPCPKEKDSNGYYCPLKK